MSILMVDTSYNKLVVVAKDGDRVESRVISEGMKKNNSLIIPAINDVLTDLGIKLADIDYFAGVVGPGSFTGVRIGVSTLNAFNLVFNKKLVSITALELIAYNIKAPRYMTSIDARHNNYYSAVFNDDYTHPVEYICNTKADIDDFKGGVYYQDTEHYDINALIGVAEHKINNGEFVRQLKPLYMKDSQAEREYAEKHKGC